MSSGGVTGALRANPASQATNKHILRGCFPAPFSYLWTKPIRREAQQEPRQLAPHLCLCPPQRAHSCDSSVAPLALQNPISALLELEFFPNTRALERSEGTALPGTARRVRRDHRQRQEGSGETRSL